MCDGSSNGGFGATGTPPVRLQLQRQPTRRGELCVRARDIEESRGSGNKNNEGAEIQKRDEGHTRRDTGTH